MAVPKNRDELVVALAGQPNCGKSTLFNAVADFRVETGNFSGTSVSFSETMLKFEGRSIRLIDLPGTYSVSSSEPAERVARDFLLSGEVDVIINVLDSSLMSRSLEFTLQLVEMGIPTVVCLNMIDEATRKGIRIDTKKLKSLTGLSAFPVVAVLGSGIDDLFREAVRLSGGGYSPVRPEYDRDVEECIAGILRRYPQGLIKVLPMDPRFVAVRMLEMDADFEKIAGGVDAGFLDYVKSERKRLAEMHGWPESGVFASHRHAIVMDLYERVATHSSRSGAGFGEKLDALMTNPVGGLVVIGGSLLLAFYTAFFLGDLFSRLLEGPFGALRGLLSGLGHGIAGVAVSGLVEGVIAGAGIVLPYLVPLLLLLALFEDTGFLPRIAFMVDGLLHRVGLHGKSVVPLILGFGCNVPAIMATRNLENPRDRLITMLIIPFVTCSARSVIIIALAGKFLGAAWAAAIYLFVLCLALLLSYVLSRFNVGATAGLIEEVPPLRMPFPAITAKKVWMRLREFLVVAWPVIMVSSVALSAMSHYGVSASVNSVLSPLTTSILDLPENTGISLFLGLFRKELTLVMLGEALGTTDVSAVLTHLQILVLVIFTVLYIPCFATLATLWKEGGWRTCLYSTLLNLGVALAVAGTLAHLVPAF